MSSVVDVYQTIIQNVDIFDFSEQEFNDPLIENILMGKIDTNQYYYIALYFLYKLCNESFDTTKETYKCKILKNLTLDLRNGQNKLRTIYAFANFFCLVKEYASAIRYFQAGTKTNDVRFMNGLGDMYMKQKKYEKAVEYYELAVKNKDYSKLNNIGYCYDRLGELDTAIKYFERAVDNGDIFALDNIGIIYHYCLQNTVKAIRFYKKAIEHGNLFAIEHFLIINNNIDNVVKCIKKGISNGIHYSFTTHKDFKRETKSTYLYDNQVLLYYFRKLINDDNKFTYQSPDKTPHDVTKFRNQIINTESKRCRLCLDETQCITDINNATFCTHCHMQLLYSNKT